MMTSNNKINTKNTMPITEKPKMEIKQKGRYLIKVKEEQMTLIKVREGNKPLMKIKETDNSLMKVREQGGYLIEIREEKKRLIEIRGGGYATDPDTCRPPSKLPPYPIGFFENLDFWRATCIPAYLFLSECGINYLHSGQQTIKTRCRLFKRGRRAVSFNL